MCKIIIYNVKKLTQDELHLPSNVTFVKWADVDSSSPESIKNYIDSKNNEIILAIADNYKVANAFTTSLLAIDGINRKDVMFITTSNANIPAGKWTGINHAIVNLYNGYQFLRTYIENISKTVKKIDLKSMRLKYDLTVRDIEILSDNKWTNSVISNIENGKLENKYDEYLNDLQNILSSADKIDDILNSKYDYVIATLKKVLNITSKQIAKDLKMSDTTVSRALNDINSGNNFAIRNYLAKIYETTDNIDTKVMCEGIQASLKANGLIINDLYIALSDANRLKKPYTAMAFHSLIINGKLDKETALDGLFASNIINNDKNNLIKNDFFIEESVEDDYFNDDDDYDVVTIEDDADNINNVDNGTINIEESKEEINSAEEKEEKLNISEALSVIKAGSAVTNDKLNAENKVLMLKDGKPTICIIKYEPVEFDSAILLEDNWYIKK